MSRMFDRLLTSISRFQFPAQFLPGLLLRSAGRLAAGPLRLQTVRLLRLQGVPDRCALCCGFRLLSSVRDLHRAPGGPLGQEEDGRELLRDLHLLLPHQALLQLLVAVHRQDLWRNRDLNALLNIRVMVSINHHHKHKHINNKHQLCVLTFSISTLQVRVRALRASRIPLRVDWDYILGDDILERDSSYRGRHHIQPHC